MRFSQVTKLPLFFLLLALVACGNPQEEARIKLGQMNVKYNEDSFTEAARNGDALVVKLFLQAGMKPNVTDKNGDIALLNAARYGRQELVALLLDHGADPNVTDKQHGATPLMWASVGGSTASSSSCWTKGPTSRPRTPGKA